MAKGYRIKKDIFFGVLDLRILRMEWWAPL